MVGRRPHNYSVVSGDIGGSKQKSTPIHLVAGQAYYFEVLQKEGGGGDHVSVAWSTNTNITPTSVNIIPASVLSSTLTGAPSGGARNGLVKRDYWTGISGTLLTNLTNHSNFPNSPSGSDLISSGLEAVGWVGSANVGGTSNWSDNYGQKLFGYIVPTTTGNYTFWIASDDYSRFSLSSDGTVGNLASACWIDGWTQLHNFGSANGSTTTQQKSSPIHLVADQSYYFEVLHKEGGGGDHVFGSVVYQFEYHTNKREYRSCQCSLE